MIGATHTRSIIRTLVMYWMSLRYGSKPANTRVTPNVKKNSRIVAGIRNSSAVNDIVHPVTAITTKVNASEIIMLMSFEITTEMGNTARGK